MSDSPLPLVPTGDLELVAELAGMRSLLARIADGINKGADWGAVDRVEKVTWPEDGTYELDLARSVPGIGVYNRSRVTAYVGLSPNRGNAADAELEVPGGAWRTLPFRTSWLSIGGVGAGTAELVVFAVPPPFDGNTIRKRPAMTTTPIAVGGAATTQLVAAPGDGYAIRASAWLLTLAAGVTGQFRSGATNKTGAILDPGASATGTADDPVLLCDENEALNLVTVGGGAAGFVTWFTEPV